MRSDDDRTILPFRNVFTPTFLERLGERDEPPTAGEADLAGSWRGEEIPGAFRVFRAGETAARGFPPYAVFAAPPLTLLAAALLPGTGMEVSFRLQKEAGPSGYAVTERGGEEVGRLQLFDEKLVDAMNVLDALLRTPETLAGVLEAAGAVALERAARRKAGTGCAPRAPLGRFLEQLFLARAELPTKSVNLRRSGRALVYKLSRSSRGPSFSRCFA
jgi:hypothetical protein